jgi:chaperonin GroEL (HSP60 family)
MLWILVYIKNKEGNLFRFLEGKNYGVDVNSASGIINTYTAFIWEPIIVKQNALSAATEVFLPKIRESKWILF